jgi:hypothetical protein
METIMLLALMLIGGCVIYAFFTALLRWWDEFDRSTFGDND